MHSIDSIGHLPDFTGGRKGPDMPFTATLPILPRDELFSKPAETTSSPIILADFERAMSSALPMT